MEMVTNEIMCSGKVVQTVADFYAAKGFVSSDCVAVAFSGGADSVALLLATRRAGYRCVALHCNFHLRGDESNRDEMFSRRVAEQLGCEFRVAHFDVDERRRLTGESVEMACRALRYEWFAEQFAQAQGAWKCVAIAHHADDDVETFFLNLMRGTGLRGLRGIPQQRDIYLRPLLAVSRADILTYLAAEGMDYIVDSTNLSSEYRRNSLRNEIFPLMKQHFPRMAQAVTGTMTNISRDYALLESLVGAVADECVNHVTGEIVLEKIVCREYAAALLWHLLNPENADDVFPFATAEAIVRSHTGSGLRFRSSSGAREYVLDRGVLIPTKVKDDVVGGLLLPMVVDWEAMAEGDDEDGNLPFRCEILSRDEFVPTRNASVLWLDADALKQGGELVIRRWQKGDRIHPFGMRGSRLVSDIYSDAKLSLIDKEHVWLLTCGEKVLWVPGLRTSKYFQIVNKTQKVVKISIITEKMMQINKF